MRTRQAQKGSKDPVIESDQSLKQVSHVMHDRPETLVVVTRDGYVAGVQCRLPSTSACSGNTFNLWMGHRDMKVSNTLTFVR